MFESEQDVLKCGEEHIIQEYNDFVKEFKQELETCKTEQNGIRSELQALQIESKNSGDAIRDYISRIHLEQCNNEDAHDKIVTNLKERIAMLQVEKDSAVQLWQTSMKAVDALEQELKTRPVDGRDAKFHEEHLKGVRQSYSEAIKALEVKLLQARENFAMQKSLLATSNETIESLKREKQEKIELLQQIEHNFQEKDRENLRKIHSLTEELTAAKSEIRWLTYVKSDLEKKLDDSKIFAKSDLEKKLHESKIFANNIMRKNEEMKIKMAEALDLIEAAVKEKDLVLQREAQIIEEKAKLEVRLTSIAGKHPDMQAEIARLKEAHECTAKKYQLEIKELRLELRDKMTLLDRSQRENALVNEELERMGRNFEDLLEKSAAKNLNSEQIPKDANSKSEVYNEPYEKQHNLELQQLREKIVNLEEKLMDSSFRVEEILQQINIRNYIKSTDQKSNARYVTLDSELGKDKDDKEILLTELKHIFDREIHKQDYEKHVLECEVKSAIPQKPDFVMENKLATNVPVQISSHREETSYKHALRNENMGHNSLLTEQLDKQEHFDKKMQEMMKHVRIHQKLSRRWREEAKNLTVEFQAKSKKFHGIITALRKEKAELQAILIYGQQYGRNAVHNYIQGSETR